MRLVVFDIDGTLVDSQHHIHQAMSHAFEFAGLNPLPPQQVLALVGLSLPVAVSQLVPQADAETQARIVAGYRTAFVQARMAEEAPLYPGALDCLDTLWTRSDLMLGVATGKSRRGLETMIEVHGLKGALSPCRRQIPTLRNPRLTCCLLRWRTRVSARIMP